MNNFERFKELSIDLPIGCSINLTLPKFNGWLDEIKDGHKDHVRFTLFFQTGLTQERTDKFLLALNDRFPTNQIEAYTDVTDEEMTQMVEFCAEFNGEPLEEQ